MVEREASRGLVKIITIRNKKYKNLLILNTIFGCEYYEIFFILNIIFRPKRFFLRIMSPPLFLLGLGVFISLITFICTRKTQVLDVIFIRTDEVNRKRPYGFLEKQKTIVCIWPRYCDINIRFLKFFHWGWNTINHPSL